MLKTKRMKTALITGINGFVGSHLAEFCIAKGWVVHGTLRSFRSCIDNIKHIIKSIKTHVCDITDYTNVADTIRSVKPDYIFHLAAQSYVPDSWTAPQSTINANVIGTLNLLEAIRHKHPEAVMQFASSSEIYGQVEPSECPITEDQPLRPLSSYGVSKAAADMLVRQYVASYGIRAIVTRAFNHSGPRRGEVFAESDWAKQIALAEIDKGPYEIVHGNLDAIRDYTDVRDIVAGYVAAVELGKAGEVYNLASGNSPTMDDVLDMLQSSGMKKFPRRLDSKRMRPSDVPRLVGNAKKAAEHLGWKPTYSMPKTFNDLLDYWRAKVREGLT